MSLIKLGVINRRSYMTHPSDKTIIYSTMTDGIKINSITVRDVKIVLQ